MLNLEVSKVGREKKFTEAIARSFNIETLKKMLNDRLSRVESNSYSEFGKAFLIVLNKQAPLKTRFIRHNNNPFFMTSWY